MMTDTHEKLSLKERAEYTALVKVVRTGVAGFIEAGQALATIREKKLYREGYRTFDEFCKKEFRMSTSYASRLIASFHTVEEISKSGEGDFPFSERVAREFRDVPLDLKQTVWERAKQISNGHKPTSEVVKKAAIEVVPHSKEKQREFQDRELLERLKTAKRLLSVEVDVSKSPLLIVNEAMRLITQIGIVIRTLRKSLLKTHQPAVH